MYFSLIPKNRFCKHFATKYKCALRTHIIIHPYFKLIKNNFDILNMLVAMWMRRIVLLYDCMAS